MGIADKLLWTFLTIGYWTALGAVLGIITTLVLFGHPYLQLIFCAASVGVCLGKGILDAAKLWIEK